MDTISIEDLATLLGVEVDDVRARVRDGRLDLPSDWIAQGRARGELLSQALGREVTLEEAIEMLGRLERS